MPIQQNDFQDLMVAVERLQAALAKLRQILPSEDKSDPACVSLKSATDQLRSIRVITRFLQAETDVLQTRLDRTIDEVWHLKAKRAELTAKLWSRERLLDRIHRSAVW